MKTKIKLLGVGIFAFASLFLGVGVVSADSSTVTTCTSAIVHGVVTDTNNVPTSVWFEWGTNFSSVDNGSGSKTQTQVFSVPQSFNQTLLNLTPSTTYYYRAMFSNVYGTAKGATLSFSTPACASTGTQPSVNTNAATSVTQSSAVMNGNVTPNGANTYAWFEWGMGSSFGNATASINYGTGATSFNSSLTNLSANTTYYYRAVAQNSQGTVYGNSMSFTTSGSGSQSQPSVITQAATNFVGNSATLNGYVDPNGSSNTIRWFEWGTNPNPAGQGQTTHYSQGSNSGNFSESLYGLAQNTTYYYRAVAQNSQGTVYGGIYSFSTGNTGNNCGSWGWGSNCGNSMVMVSTRNAETSSDFAVLNGYVDPNNTNDTVRWFEWGGSQSLGNSTQKLSHGSVASSFSASLTGLVANTTYYYRAAARNSQGTVYGNTLSFTTNAQTTGVLGGAPSATTLLATELTGSVAKLNGLVFASANQPSNAWFEWGVNSSLGNRTQTVSVGALPSVLHTNFISGLVKGQTYYYRIVAENPYGKTYGSVNTFVSEPSVPVAPATIVDTPVVLKPTTTVITRGSSAQSLVALSVEGGAEMINIGEKRTYQVSWKNESAQTLKNVVLRITFPQSMKLESATKGSFSSADNSVVVDLKTLDPKESGDTFIFASVGRGVKADELLVVTANMVYTDSRGVQGDAIAYVTHRANVAQSAIGANILGAGDFIPTTLFEWIILMILVLILVLLGNHLYGRFADERH